MPDPLGFSTGRDPWNDSPYRQEVPSSAGASSSSSHQTPATPASAISSNATSHSSPPDRAITRDPRIFGQPSPSLTSPMPQQGSSQGDQSSLRVRIGGLERNRKDLLVRFDASTNLPNFRTSLYRNMQRSYQEFQLFAEQLAYGNPQTIIPALPLPQTSAVTDEEDDRLVKGALQKWFTRVCDDAVLQKDDELRSFIESDFGYQPVPRHNAASSSFSHTASTTASYSRTAGAFPSAIVRVFKRGPPDEDEDLVAARVDLERLEERWAGAAGVVGKMGVGKRALSQAQADTGAKLISLAVVEPDVSLSNALRKLGRGWESLGSLSQAQAVSDNIVLSDSLGYQALNARAAKETLIHRVHVLEEAQSASKVAITKRRTVERMKGSTNISAQKVDDAIEEMQDAQQLDTQLSARVQAISTNLRNALVEHSKQTHEDAAAILFEYARTRIMYERQTLKELEAIRPDVRAIGSGATGKRETARAAVPNSDPFISRGPPVPAAGFERSTAIPTPSPLNQPVYANPPLGSSSPYPVTQPPLHTVPPGPSHDFNPPQRAVFQAPPPQQHPPSSYHHPQQQQPPMAQSMFIPPQHPQQHSNAMAQSMFIPANQQGPQQQRRRLDDRAAARSLANMF